MNKIFRKQNQTLIQGTARIYSARMIISREKRTTNKYAAHYAQLINQERKTT